MTDRTDPPPKRHLGSQLDNTITQNILIAALGLVGLGNIVIPPSAPTLLHSIYLPISLVVIATIVAIGSTTIAQTIKQPFTIGLFCLSVVPGFLIAPLEEYGRTKLLAMAIAVLLIIAPHLLGQREEAFSRLFMLIFSISAIMATVALIVSDTDSSGRLQAFGINPIPSGRLFGLAPLIAIAYMLGQNRPKISLSVLITLASGAGVVALVLTGSRGPLISLVAAVAVICIVRLHSLLHRPVFTILGITAVTVGIYLAFETTNQPSRITSASSSGRDLLYQESLRLVSSNPLGVGWGNLGSNLPPMGLGNRETLYAHNILLEIAAEAGWIAVIAFVLLICGAAINSVRAIRGGSTSAVMTLALLVFAVTGALFSSDVVGSRLMWLSIGLALAHNHGGDHSTEPAVVHSPGERSE